MVVISTIFRHYHNAFPLRWFNPTFACPWRAVNVPSNISSVFLTEITWDENYPYILINQGPYWIVIAKEDLLLCFRSNTVNRYFEHSEILSWRIAKYGKIIFNGLFQKRSVFQKLVHFIEGSTLAFPRAKDEPNRFFDCSHEFLIFVWFLLTFTLNKIEFLN